MELIRTLGGPMRWILVALAVGVLAEVANSQPGGRPGGGQPGGFQPPGNPGFRQPGGNPGFQPPGNPGGFQPGGNPGFQPNPGVPMTIKVWKCGKCGAQVGTGEVEPNISRCPHCGVRLRSGSAGWVGGGIGVGVLVVCVIIGLVKRMANR
jgi:hypothetical protein